MNKTPSHDQHLERRLEIVYRQIGELKPDPANARQHSKKQIRQLARSIETFGFNVPALVNAELTVIAGHGRLLACRELGITEVPTLCLDHLTRAQARAFMIADNRLTEIASWIPTLRRPRAGPPHGSRFGRMIRNRRGDRQTRDRQRI
jgi:ParB-like chromosome segregation protein Spo0J